MARLRAEPASPHVDVPPYVARMMGVPVQSPSHAVVAPTLRSGPSVRPSPAGECAMCMVHNHLDLRLVSCPSRPVVLCTSPFLRRVAMRGCGVFVYASRGRLRTSHAHPRVPARLSRVLVRRRRRRRRRLAHWRSHAVVSIVILSKPRGCGCGRGPGTGSGEGKRCVEWSCENVCVTVTPWHTPSCSC